MSAHSGLFLSFEGTEGSGKSTQRRLLVERLRARGWAVVENQEPGATVIGREIRRVLLDPAHAEMTPMTELLLMFASRAQAAAEIVRPALKRGAIVVSDRFTDSTLAYQGYAREIGAETVMLAHRLALGALWPDRTFAIELDLATGLERAHRRNQENGGAEARIDRQSLAFHERVAAGYRAIAQAEPERFRMIDGRGSPEEVAERVWRQTEELLGVRALARQES